MPDNPAKNPNADNDRDGRESGTGIVGDKRPNTTANESKSNSPRINWPTAWGVFVGAGALIAVAVLFYQGVQWISEKVDSTVETKLSDKAVLRKIAAEARPMLIFDEDKSVVIDMGAGQYVKDIQVTKTNGPTFPDNFPHYIRVELNRHFSNVLLFSMETSETITIFPKRSELFAWEFSLKIHGGSYGFEKPKRQYRLELFP